MRNRRPRHLLLTIGLAANAAVAQFAPNEPFELGVVERDLTGDGMPETLRLTASGPAIDALDVTFTIESAGNVVYAYRLAPLTRTVGFDAGQHEITAEEHQARLREFGPTFFGQGQFQPPADFIAEFGAGAQSHLAAVPAVIERDRPTSDARDGRTIWQEIQTSPVTIFHFSPGGDRAEAIAWSSEAGRFYRLLECC